MPDTDPSVKEAAAQWTGAIPLQCFIATFTGVIGIVCGLVSLLLWSCESKWAAGCVSSKTAVLHFFLSALTVWYVILHGCTAVVDLIGEHTRRMPPPSH